MVMRIFKNTAMMILIVALLLPFASAEEPIYCVIVHHDSDLQQISHSEIERIFLGKKTLWSSGKRIKPIMLELEGRVTEAFIEDVLRLTPSKFRNHWRRRLFSGGGAPPRMLESQEKVLTELSKYPNAIAIAERTSETSHQCIEVKR